MGNDDAKTIQPGQGEAFLRVSLICEQLGIPEKGEELAELLLSGHEKQQDSGEARALKNVCERNSTPRKKYAEHIAASLVGFGPDVQGIGQPGRAPPKRFTRTKPDDFLCDSREPQKQAWLDALAPDPRWELVKGLGRFIMGKGECPAIGAPAEAVRDSDETVAALAEPVRPELAQNDVEPIAALAELIHQEFPQNDVEQLASIARQAQSSLTALPIHEQKRASSRLGEALASGGEPKAPALPKLWSPAARSPTASRTKLARREMVVALASLGLGGMGYWWLGRKLPTLDDVVAALRGLVVEANRRIAGLEVAVLREELTRLSTPETYFFVWGTGARRGECPFHPIMRWLMEPNLNALEIGNELFLAEHDFDDNCIRAIEQLTALAETERNGASHIYLWPNPITHELEQKIAYIQPFSVPGWGTAFVGTGMFLRKNG